MKHVSISIAFILFLELTLNAQEGKRDTNYADVKDTVRISWGTTKIILIDSNEDDKGDTIKVKKQRFNHFAGVDIGVNGLLTDKKSVDLGREGDFMDLNYGKSISIAFNFWESYIPIAKEKFGLSTGLGVEFNKYDLDRTYDVISTKDTTYGIQNTTKSFEKNIFKSTVINLPIFLETNIGKDAAHSFHLAVGVQGSYRLGSKSKQVYTEDGKDYKVKNRNDHNMNDFRFNAVARIGYGHYSLFAAYSLTPMFEKDKGPELYPFTVGISVLSW